MEIGERLMFRYFSCTDNGTCTFTLEIEIELYGISAKTVQNIAQHGDCTKNKMKKYF